MTTEEFKEITRAVVDALRKELSFDNAEILKKLTSESIGGGLEFDGEPVFPGISNEIHNNLSVKTDGLYARNNYVTTESSPVGEIIAFMGTTAPEHYLTCDGATYSIGSYPVLEQFFKTQFGSVNHFGGDGTTTFAVPDLRGEFLRGSGMNGHSGCGNGADVGVHQNGTTIMASWAGDSFVYPRNESIQLPGANFDTSTAHPSAVSAGSATSRYDNSVGKGTTRPTNTSVMYCIKYEPTSVDEIRFVVTRPDLWPLDTEVDLGNGLYGIRKKGTISSAANTSFNLLFQTLPTSITNISLVSYGGYFCISSGYTVSVGSCEDDNYSSVVWVGLSERTINISTKTSGVRTDAPYDLWVTYRKE